MTDKPVLIMSQWAIYDHPLDFPDKYVMRRWDVYRGVINPIATKEVAFADTLEDIRKRVPPGLYRIPRYTHDDPAIVEVWL